MVVPAAPVVVVPVQRVRPGQVVLVRPEDQQPYDLVPAVRERPAAPLSLPAGHFGLGHGSGAHAPDEYYVVESTNSKVSGIVDATLGYVDMFYQIATVS